MPTSITISQQLEELSSVHDLSVAKLKAVYFRGVNEFIESEITYGSATMYGLARVQRFISEGGSVIDTDLASSDNDEVIADGGFDLVFDNSLFLLDTFYSDGEEVAKLFAPGETTSISIDETQLQVMGVLGQLSWSYVLDTTTGAADFTIQ